MAAARLMAAALVFFGLVSAAQAERRVALVIGNSNYLHSSVLKNPANDAAAISSALVELGFDVIEGRDLTHAAMQDKLREFNNRLSQSDVAVVFYAGHGVQVDGRNFLIPIDAKILSEADLELGALDLEVVMRVMQRGPRVRIIFLDACRDNPMSTQLAQNMGGRSGAVGRGLARVDADIGTLVAYATQPGAIAADGAGLNSPFTEALLKVIKEPGLEIGQMMKRVRLTVVQNTNQQQVPWDHSSLIDDFFFRPAAAVDTIASAPLFVPGPSQVPITPGVTASAEACLKANLETADGLSRCEMASRAEPANMQLRGRYGEALFWANRYDEAVRELRPAADWGDMLAQFRIAWMFDMGLGGLPKEPEMAASFYLLAANQGMAAAQTNLGFAHEIGRGVPKDEATAMKYYLAAAEKGDSYGLHNAGIMFLDGRGGVAKDEKTALSYFRRAADLGNPLSHAQIGWMYELGQAGLPKDLAQAVYYYRFAADNGVASSQRALGWFYENGLGGLPKDDAQAVTMYRKAAAQGDAVAQNNLGFMHEVGRGGLTPDAVEARRFYELAAAQGEPSGIHNLALLHEDGRGGLPKNEVEAARLYRLAADKNYASSMNNLAIFYEQGRGGLPKDLNQAIALYRQAAGMGDPSAKTNLKRLGVEL